MSDVEVSPGRDTGVMRPGPHGGMLRVGGKPGNRGGPGRKPAAIRKKALKMLWNRLDLVGHLADGVTVEFTDEGGTKLVSPRPGERLQAMKLLAELGMSERVPVGDIRQRLTAQVAVLRAELEPAVCERVLAKLGEVWR